MLNINKVLDIAIREDASDVHLIKGLKPIMRISRELKEIEGESILGETELYEAYDYFVRGNIDKDEVEPLHYSSFLLFSENNKILANQS